MENTTQENTGASNEAPKAEETKTYEAERTNGQAGGTAGATGAASAAAEPSFEPAKNDEEKRLASLAHIISLAGFLVPFGNIVGPLVMFLVRKDDQKFLGAHAKESLNFQITWSIYYAIAGILVFVFIGFVILPVLAIIAIVLTIVAAVKAHEGGTYRYPATFRFIK